MPRKPASTATHHGLRPTPASTDTAMPSTPAEHPPAPSTRAGTGRPTSKPDPMIVHGRDVPGSVYRAAITPMIGNSLAALPDPRDYAEGVIEGMAPRDAAEEMLIAQMLFAHARAMRLTAMANNRSDLKSVRVLHEYADRASNTYRRLMLALAEYRRPPRAGGTFTAIKQANIAGQQVIQNHEIPTRTLTNEQGCPGHADE